MLENNNGPIGENDTIDLSSINSFKENLTTKLNKALKDGTFPEAIESLKEQIPEQSEFFNAVSKLEPDENGNIELPVDLLEQMDDLEFKQKYIEAYLESVSSGQYDDTLPAIMAMFLTKLPNQSIYKLAIGTGIKKQRIKEILYQKEIPTEDETLSITSFIDTTTDGIKENIDTQLINKRKQRIDKKKKEKLERMKKRILAKPYMYPNVDLKTL